MQKRAELYRGKAKTVYSTDNPDLLVLEFRNDTSAGDGARIEQFDRKGMVNNKFNHFIMTKLAEAGIPTQMEALLSDTECLVKKLDMVPVECVIRNRAAGSLVKRLGIEEGIELNPPLFDLFLKNDAMHDPKIPKDKPLQIRMTRVSDGKELGWADEWLVAEKMKDPEPDPRY